MTCNTSVLSGEGGRFLPIHLSCLLVYACAYCVATQDPVVTITIKQAKAGCSCAVRHLCVALYDLQDFAEHDDMVAYRDQALHWLSQKPAAEYVKHALPLNKRLIVILVTSRISAGPNNFASGSLQRTESIHRVRISSPEHVCQTGTPSISRENVYHKVSCPLYDLLSAARHCNVECDHGRWDEA